MKQQINKKEITLDVLANMVAKGFESSDQKLNHIENKMATKIDLIKVEQRLGNLEYQVDEVHDILKRFEENDILNLQKRVQILEKAVRALANNQTAK